LTGFEHGVLSTSGGGLFNGIGGTVGTNIAVQSTTKRSGAYALRIYPGSSTACYITRNVSSSVLVGRIYVRWEDLPTVNHIIVRGMTASQVCYIYYDYNSGNPRLYALVNGSTPQYSATGILAADTWFRIDFRFDASTGTTTIDWQIEGSPQTQATRTVAANTFSIFNIGMTTASVADFCVDDVFLSATSGDYPIGEGSVVGLSPSGAGTSSPGSNIKDDAGNVVNDSTNPANAELDDVPLDGATDYIQQDGGASSIYAEATLADTTKGTINGAIGIIAYQSSSATANSASTRVLDEDSAEQVIYTGDMSETSQFYKSAVIPAPAGGWDQAAVNALRVRVGFATDYDGIPRWHGFMVEVDGVDSSSTPKSVTDSGSGSEAVSIKAIVGLSDAGSGADAVAGLAAKVSQADSGSGADAVAAVLARIPVSDFGAAVDAVTRIIQGSSKFVSDTGSGSDVVAALLAKVGLADAGAGLDLTTIRALLSLADSGAGADVPAKTEAAVQKTVSDSGLGADLAAVLARAALADAGLGADLVAAIRAHISVSDLGSGADYVFRWVVGTAVLLELLRPVQRIVTLPESPRVVKAKPVDRIVLTDRS
jgi:hypothetical protein